MNKLPRRTTSRVFARNCWTRILNMPGLGERRSDLAIRVASTTGSFLAEDIERRNMYLPRGVFRRVVKNPDLPKVGSAVFLQGDLVSYAMLFPRHDGASAADEDGLLGIVGVYTDERMRGRGFGTAALAGIFRSLDYALTNEELKRACVAAESRIVNQVQRVFDIPVIPRWSEDRTPNLWKVRDALRARRSGMSVGPISSLA